VLTIHLSIVIFLPLAAALVGALVPGWVTRWVVLVGALAVVAYVVAMLADFPTRGGGLSYVTNEKWITELGINYRLGIDGLNLFLVALTAIGWAAATLWTFFQTPGRSTPDGAGLRNNRPKLFYFHLGLAETAVLGAFCAQDLALFVVFFDLMLVPFYFLIGGWGGEERVRATTKFVIYTLVGSLLMLAAAVALGVLATPEGGHISFSMADLQHRTISEGSQEWIFLLFAVAFLVKAPLFPLHGWVPETYRATPIPVLALLSGVLSKVGVYGFLRIVLPILPGASAHFQELMVAIAVFSILYGSVLAFSQDNLRLVIAYSSIAQLGFIVLGIFSLDPKGAQGALMQMVNHGLVVVPLFLIIGAVAARADGSESLSELGGMAVRAPVLAAVFLIVTFATLAMPGSPNFVGELLILFGTFQNELVYGLVAAVGVVLASVYMIRVYQRTMHNRSGPKVASRDLRLPELVTIAPVVAVVVALGIYPHFFLNRSEDATAAKGRKAGATAAADNGRRGWTTYAPLKDDR
jgi:NADH-quinone oxidoreductase subunit M